MNDNILFSFKRDVNGRIVCSITSPGYRGILTNYISSNRLLNNIKYIIERIFINVQRTSLLVYDGNYLVACITISSPANRFVQFQCEHGIRVINDPIMSRTFKRIYSPSQKVQLFNKNDGSVSNVYLRPYLESRSEYPIIELYNNI